MQSSKAILIINPEAGRGLGRERGAAIGRYLHELGLPTRILNSAGPGDVQTKVQAALAEKPKLVIAAGGDGTVHEAVNGWMRAGGGAPLGVVPVGTGNDFVKMLDLTHDWREACWRIVRGDTRRVDVGRCTGTYERPGRQDAGRDGCTDFFFANSLGIGFDAQVALEANKIRWIRGNAVYGLALAKILTLMHSTPEVRIRHDGEKLATPITLLTINNGRVEGGAFVMAPEAEIDDGLFDVVVAKGMGRLGVLQLLPQVLKGQHMSHPKVVKFRTGRLSVEADVPLPIHADGELTYTGAKKLEIEVLPRALEVIC
ncbi:MAG TPA: diacylglycerol kinase family protein [Gammaproteobacteria bacterium]|jgi:YegS/Rv2252/BmrU family lipid kinase